MNGWQHRVVEVLNILLGHPTSQGVLLLYSCIAFLVFLALLNRLTRMLKFPVSGLPYSLLTTLITMVFMVAGAWLALVHIGPLGFVRRWELITWVPYIGALLPLFVIVAPLMRLINRSHYGESISALVLSMAAVACAVGIAYSVTAAVTRGDRDFNDTRKRTATLNHFLND